MRREIHHPGPADQGDRKRVFEFEDWVMPWWVQVPCVVTRPHPMPSSRVRLSAGARCPVCPFYLPEVSEVRCTSCCHEPWNDVVFLSKVPVLLRLENNFNALPCIIAFDALFHFDIGRAAAIVVFQHPSVPPGGGKLLEAAFAINRDADVALGRLVLSACEAFSMPSFAHFIHTPFRDRD